MLLYSVIAGTVSAPPTPAASVQCAVKVEGYRVLKFIGVDYAAGFELPVRCVRGGSGSVDAVYVDLDGSSIATVTVTEGKLSVGKLVLVRAYPREMLRPGSYRLRVVASGAEAAIPITLAHPTGASVALKAAPENNVSNPVTVETVYVVYEVYVNETQDGNYMVVFRVYAKPGIRVLAVYAELFSVNGTHPIWVGGNPWTWSQPYTYPDWAGAEWWPVRPDEMPVTVVFSIIAERI